MRKILVVFGTRPEVIKIFPLIDTLKKKDFRVQVCNTGQQKQLSEQMINQLKINIDFDLKVMSPNQSLAKLTSTLVQKLDNLIKDISPDLVICHGDTTTSLCAGISSFYNNVPVAHVEAGLRTKTIKSPFPEEFNRRVISILCDLNFAPTRFAKDNLISEGVSKKKIFITGNTVIDSVLISSNRLKNDKNLSKADEIYQKNKISKTKRMILVTGHRRENFGRSFKNIFSAFKSIANKLDVEIIYPVHLNPGVKKDAQDFLGNAKNIHLIKPVEYYTFIDLMQRSYLILTDSGGIQEEAPSLGKPVLVLRKETERPEGIIKGTSILVGVDQKNIFKEVKKLLKDANYYKKICKSKNPFGDGNASIKIANQVERFLT